MIALLVLANTRPVFTEREYLIGGTGKVRSIYDLSDATRTHVLDQSDTAKQVDVPAPHADFLQPCYTWPSGQFWYASNRPMSYWDFLINGNCSGSAVLTQTAASANKVIWESAASRGLQLQMLSGDATYRVGIFRTTFNLTVANNAPIGTPQQVSMHVDASVSPNISLKCTGQSAVTTASLPGSSATTDQAFTFGGRSGSSSLGFVGRVCVLFAGTPGAASLPAMQAALQQYTGVAS